MSDREAHVRALIDEIEFEMGEDGLAGEHGPIDADGRVEAAVREICRDRRGSRSRWAMRTPERVHRMYAELTAGYRVDPDRLINGAVFEVDYSEMVIVKDIPFYSLCEHHLLPFFGSASVAYIPRGRVIGLSKIPRIVEMYARRLQVQERLTQQIADYLQTQLQPQGVGVVMEATHLCAVMRGVRKPGTIMTTSAVLGIFRSRDKTRAEFLAHLERRPPGSLSLPTRARSGPRRRRLPVADGNDELADRAPGLQVAQRGGDLGQGIAAVDRWPDGARLQETGQRRDVGRVEWLPSPQEAKLPVAEG